MAAPDMYVYLEGLIGRTLPTVTGKPNEVVRVDRAGVVVATRDNAGGSVVSVAFVQGVVDRVFAGEEVVLDPRRRSAFIAAVLLTMDDVEVLTDPRRLRSRARAAQNNPDWEFDELILALDLYLRWRPHQPPTGHPDLQALSDMLQRLQIHPETARAASFRDTNSLRRKLGDFRRPIAKRRGRPLEGARCSPRVGRVRRRPASPQRGDKSYPGCRRWLNTAVAARRGRGSRR